MAEKCPRCREEMVRDVPLKQVAKDAVGVFLNPITALTKSFGYHTEDHFYKCKHCGYSKHSKND